MTYSLTPNTAHYEEKFDNSENNYENKYKLLEDIGEATNSVFFDKDKQNIENDHECVPDDNLNEDWAAVTLYTMTDKEYMETITKLIEEQRNIYLLVENHINGNQQYKQSLTKVPPNPLFLFITGGEGTGKSFLINLIRELVFRKTKRKSILLTAPTGCAAYNIGGSTLHSAFSLPVQHPKSFFTSKSSCNPLSAARRDQLQSDYSNLEYLVIDEISMVSDNMFHFVHQRLEEIKNPQSCMSNLFGNCSVIAFGDFYQLQPVAAHYIFDEITYTGEMNLWVTHFKPIFLVSNVRQKDDSEYANLLNRVRIGKQTINDIHTLVQRTKINVNEAPFKNANKKTVP